MNSFREIVCFIASPGDTQEERKACVEVFEDINHGFGKSLGFCLSPFRWDYEVYPSVGEYGQQVINEQADGKYDLFVGIMKTRFGSPTPNAGSGTEEEFNIAYEKFQKGEIDNIFFYFGNPTLSLNDIDLVQTQQVRNFKKRLEGLGVVYLQYTDIANFKSQLKKNLEDYFNANKPNKGKRKKQKNNSEDIVKSKVSFFDYRKLWEDVIHSKELSKNLLGRIKKMSILCRFPKVIFPQENVINQLMRKEPLTEDKAFLFALAVKDIGQIPSYYVNYHKDDAELNKQPMWIKLLEREKSLHGSSDLLVCSKEDWAKYEQIQRTLFHLDFTKAKELITNWDAKGFWVQNKAMRMAMYDDLLKEAQTRLDEAIKEEKNPSEKLYETVIANFISRRWPQPYSVDEFWRYGLDSQGDMLNYMMSSLHKKNEKPKRRGWIGSSWNFGSNHGDYVKSLRILQYIIDSGIYVSLPGTYMLDVANWYVVFENLYEHFPYPCFFYSIQYNDKDVQRRIGEDLAYNKDLLEFNRDILMKSLAAIKSPDTPHYFKKGILNITAMLYICVDESIWFDKFNDCIFENFVKGLNAIKDSDELLFNIKFALGSIKDPQNIDRVFQQLVPRYSTNEKVVSDIIVNNLHINRIRQKRVVNDTFLFPDVLNRDCLDLLDVLNKDGFLSPQCIEQICEIVCKTSVDAIPHDRVALFQLFNLVKGNTNAVKRIKQCFLSMNIWHCGELSDGEFGWTEPMYIRLNLLNDKIVWSDEEFEIIKDNLIHNVGKYDQAHKYLHEDNFMKNAQVRYLSDMLKFIDGLPFERQLVLHNTRKDVERLFHDRTQYEDNIDLLMSSQSADVDYAFGNIVDGITHNGIDSYISDIDFVIDRAIMKTPTALTRNLRCIIFIVETQTEQMINRGYAKKLTKMLEVYKDSKSWDLLDLRFAFNYLYSIAEVLKQQNISNEVINYWMEDDFVKRFVFDKSE